MFLEISVYETKGCVCMCVCVCVCVCVPIQQGEQLGNILGGKILLLVRKNFFVIHKNTLLGEEGNLGKRSNTILFDYSSSSQPEIILPSARRGHLVTCGDSFGCYNLEVLLTSIGQKRGALLNILPCTVQLISTENNLVPNVCSDYY